MSYFHINVHRTYVERALIEDGLEVLDEPRPATVEEALAQMRADPREYFGTCPAELARPDGSCPGHESELELD